MDINRQSMLVDMLMKVPADAVLWVEHETGGPVPIKVGVLCRNAAAALSTAFNPCEGEKHDRFS
jgi:hypothetical protein